MHATIIGTSPKLNNRAKVLFAYTSIGKGLVWAQLNFTSEAVFLKIAL